MPSDQKKKKKKKKKSYPQIFAGIREWSTNCYKRKPNAMIYLYTKFV